MHTRCQILCILLVALLSCQQNPSEPDDAVIADVEFEVPISHPAAFPLASVASCTTLVTSFSGRDTLAFTAEVDSLNDQLVGTIRGALTLDTAWSTVVMAFDTTGRKIAQTQDTLTLAHIASGMYIITTITLGSAIPRIDTLWSTPAEVTIGDSIQFEVGASDSFGGEITSIWWYWSPDQKNHVFPANRATFLAPLTGGVDTCIVGVTDNDGNSVEDTLLVHILLDAPTASAGNDTSLTMLDTLHLSGAQSSDGHGTILEYAWDIGNTGVFHCVSSNSTGDTSIQMLDATPLLLWSFA